jgi:hypothetical protein
LKASGHEQLPAQEVPNSGRGFETKQIEPADFFIAVQVSDTTMYSRNSAVDNRKIKHGY